MNNINEIIVNNRRDSYFLNVMTVKGMKHTHREGEGGRERATVTRA